MTLKIYVLTLLIVAFLFFSVPSVSEAGCLKNRAVVTKVTSKAKCFVQRIVRFPKQVLSGL